MAKLKKAYKNNYTILDNDIFKDKRLNCRDLGLLCQLLSLPDNWNFNVAGIASLRDDGEDCIKTGLRRLEQFGYLNRKQTRNKSGTFSKFDYFIYQNPLDNEDYVKSLEEQKDDSLTNKDNNIQSKEDISPLGENPPAVKPLAANPSAEKPLAEKPTADNQALLSNVFNKVYNNKNVVVYKNKEQLSKAINTNDIYKNNLLETMDIESFDYKKQMDYECYKSFPDIKIDIIKMMESYSVQCFRYILSCHPNSMDNVKKAQELVFKALLSNQLEGKENIIDDFSEEEYAQILNIAFSIEASDDIRVYKSPIAYLVGVIENLISQHVISKGGDVNDE